MKSKFKVGDKVRVLYSEYPSIPVGTIDVLFDLRLSGGHIRSAYGSPLYFKGDELELVSEPTYPNSVPSAMIANKTRKTTLPTDSNDRKNYPLFQGVLKYFPAALAGVARTSKEGNDKHNPGEEMHHARGKSVDHGDCIMRHLIDVSDLLAAYKRGDSSVTETDIRNEVNQMAWRALAFSQELHEELGLPLAPGAKK